MNAEGFTAREVIRRSVQKKAMGMDRERVTEEIEKARGWERQAGRGFDEPGRLDTLRRAEWKHTEWRRIGYVMKEQQLDTYDPRADPKAVQWEQARVRRAATGKEARGAGRTRGREQLGQGQGGCEWP